MYLNWRSKNLTNKIRYLKSTEMNNFVCVQLSMPKYKIHFIVEIQLLCEKIKYAVQISAFKVKVDLNLRNDCKPGPRTFCRICFCIFPASKFRFNFFFSVLLLSLQYVRVCYDKTWKTSCQFPSSACKCVRNETVTLTVFKERFLRGGGGAALSRIFYLYRADRSSKVGENWRTWGKTPDHP